jgi:hypothetical protein
MPGFRRATPQSRAGLYVSVPALLIHINAYRRHLAECCIPRRSHGVACLCWALPMLFTVGVTGAHLAFHFGILSERPGVACIVEQNLNLDTCIHGNVTTNSRMREIAV